MNYYNDNDKGAVKWIKYLIENKLIPEGKVDDRSIKDVDPDDLRGFTQCHFFAGICGWSYALQLAGWPADRPVWTGSCPCQPFSVAGKGKAEKDERHLWPHFRRLIAKSKVDIIFGEQVASKLGREWLSGVQTDMEEMGFVFGAADIPAASVGAPHIRQRLWWVADADTSSRRQNKPFRQKKERTFDWGDSTWIQCIDGKQRRIPIEPALFPLANGISHRMDLLRGTGNSIVPQVAAEFIKCFVSISEETYKNVS